MPASSAALVGEEERFREQLCIRDRAAVVRKGDRSGLLQSGEGAQGFALQSLGDAGGGVNPRVGVLRFCKQRAHRFGGVHGGPCVGHGQKAGHTARGGGFAAGEDVLLFQKSRVAQVDVHVHKTGRGGQSGRLDHVGPVGRDAGGDLLHLAAGDEHIGRLVKAACRVKHPRPAEENAVHGRASFTYLDNYTTV